MALLSVGICRFYSSATRLFHVDMLEAERVEQGGDGRAGVLARGVEDAVAEGGLLELLLRRSAGVGLEVGVGRDEQAGGAGVDTGVLLVERGDEDLRGGKGDVDGAAGCGAGGVIDPDILGLELGEIDAGDGLAVDDQQELVAGEDVGVRWPSTTVSSE
jgi:hypothetical protein